MSDPRPEPRAAIVVPVYNEGEGIVASLDRLFDAVDETYEVLVVFDTKDDTTVPHLERYAGEEARLRPLLNTYGRGPANAIRFGIERAAAPVVVVTMADASDDQHQIGELVQLVEEGAVVAAASRYSPGGRQHGGPLLKRILSRAAGLSLSLLAHVGTRDPTNSFKGYSTRFVEQVGIESRAGFEIGLELTAKARRLRLPVAEIPTEWRDRQEGASNFRMLSWLPHYFRWYRFAFGRQLRPEEIRARSTGVSQ